MSTEHKCYGCEGGEVLGGGFGPTVVMCKSCGQAIQPIAGKRWSSLLPEHLTLEYPRQSWLFDYVEYAEEHGWSRGAKSPQSKSTSEICCPNSGCRKMNDADAKSCWWCSGRLVPK